MTIKQESSAPKLSKNELKLKRGAATQMANKLLEFGKEKPATLIDGFVKIIDELDSHKDKDSRKGPKGKPFSSIFDLQIKRNKKFILEDWVKQYKESLTKTQPKMTSSSMTAA